MDTHFVSQIIARRKHSLSLIFFRVKLLIIKIRVTLPSCHSLQDVNKILSQYLDLISGQKTERMIVIFPLLKLQLIALSCKKFSEHPEPEQSTASSN